MEFRGLLLLLFSAIALHVSNSENAQERIIEGTVAFATVGRSHYAFDIYLLDLPPASLQHPSSSFGIESRITDGFSVNYNGHLVQFPEHQTLLAALEQNHRKCFNTFRKAGGPGMLAYVSEREGTVQVRFNLYMEARKGGGTGSASVSIEQKVGVAGNRRQASESAEVFDLGTLEVFSNGDVEAVAMSDRPSVADGKLIFMSTRERLKKSRQSWTAVYATDIRTGKTVRLTPENVSDYSPSVSPSGKYIMVASSGERGWRGEIQDLETDLYVFNAADGSDRRLVTQHGGWPSWSDDSTVYFHRRAEDGWWSIFTVNVSKGGESSEPERVTPPGVHAFTPAAARSGKLIAVATRRPGSAYRHVELFDLSSRVFHKVTESLAPDTHHYNPFFSPDSAKLGYHRCRGPSQSLTPRLEHIKSPVQGLSLVRVDGDFPVFSADGEQIAFIPDLDVGGIYITSLNGTGMVKVFNEPAFGLSWDKQRKGVLYTSYGSGFQSEDTSVHIVSILNADKLVNGEAGKAEWKRLTKPGTSNNAFPSVSPNGKWLVFRSGRSGHKNLYVMDAVHGEEGRLTRLTSGAWTDTMPNWSPDGEWIGFSSDRDSPGSGSFGLYFVHPDGSGLHRVLNSSTGGRVNHVFFSPDSKSMVFTTDFAGVSAEPVSTPNQFQPYGEIFLAKVDGSGLQRLTHNSFEDGTPSWGPKYLKPGELSEDGLVSGCKFQDTRWLRAPGVGNGELRDAC